MQKLLATILVFICSASVAYGAQTLYSYYAEQGMSLPSISERIPLAEQCDIPNYTGSYEQNVPLLECLQNGAGLQLGATIPTVVALFESSLRSRVTAEATSMTLVSGTDASGDALSGTIGFVIDEGTTSEEFVICTASGTALTSCLRGLDPVDGETEVTALKKEHRRGASVKISNFPQLAIISRILNGDETIPNLLTYDTSVLIGVGSATSTLTTKYYVDNVAVAGASNADESTKGIGEIATPSEMAASTPTGGTGANLILWSKYATSTSQVAQNSIVITDTDGKIDQSFYDLTEDFTWTGEHTFNATTTFSNMIDGVITFAGVAGETISALDAVYASSTDSGGYYKTQATTTVATTAPVFDGFAVSGASDGNTLYIQVAGIVSGFTGLTAGSDYYIDEDGNLSTTADSYAEVYVGKAVSTTQILIDKKSGSYVGQDSSISCTNATSSCNDTVEMPWYANSVLVNMQSKNDTNNYPRLKDEMKVTKNGITSESVSYSYYDAQEFVCSNSYSLSGSTITLTGNCTNGTTVSGKAYFYR